VDLCGVSNGGYIVLEVYQIRGTKHRCKSDLMVDISKMRRLSDTGEQDRKHPPEASVFLSHPV